jgi:hypothetical protein
MFSYCPFIPLIFTSVIAAISIYGNCVSAGIIFDRKQTVEFQPLSWGIPTLRPATLSRTENSYGYVPIKMRHEWLQNKFSNNLTLYIVDAASRLSTKTNDWTSSKTPQRHSISLASPLGCRLARSLSFSLSQGLYFGIRDNRRIGLGNVMGSRNRGYAIRQSKNQRLDGNRKKSDTSLEAIAN